LAGLRAGWDSYGAAALSPIAVQRVVNSFIEILVRDDVPIAAVVPTRVGGIQLEWHRRGMDVEIAVPPTGEIEYLVVDPGAGIDIESPTPVAEDVILSVLGRIAATR
jgi:hypothetical protein